MNAPLSPAPDSLILIAGKGAYPLELARSARAQGVRPLHVIAFKGETDRAIEASADQTTWLRLGSIDALLDAARSTGIRHAVMAGQITPTSLFSIRFDARALSILRTLPAKNADTLFGAVARELASIGIEILPAWMFMQTAMPAPGVLTRRAPTPVEARDIALGLRVAKTTSSLEIGQTVAVKDGVILAVEAFEGTDAAIRRAGTLGGPGIVVVKVAKLGHDVRFDIPVIGPRTLDGLRKVKAAVLAVEAGRTILLERERLIRAADDSGISLEAVDFGHARFG